MKGTKTRCEKANRKTRFDCYCFRNVIQIAHMFWTVFISRGFVDGCVLFEKRHGFSCHVSAGGTLFPLSFSSLPTCHFLFFSFSAPVLICSDIPETTSRENPAATSEQAHSHSFTCKSCFQPSKKGLADRNLSRSDYIPHHNGIFKTYSNHA